MLRLGSHRGAGETVRARGDIELPGSVVIRTPPEDDLIERISVIAVHIFMMAAPAQAALRLAVAHRQGQRDWIIGVLQATGWRPPPAAGRLRERHVGAVRRFSYGTRPAEPCPKGSGRTTWRSQRSRIGEVLQRCFDLSRSIDLHLESMVASGERAVAGFRRFRHEHLMPMGVLTNAIAGLYLRRLLVIRNTLLRSTAEGC